MRKERGNILLTELVNMNKWQRIQDYFSEVIGVGLRTFDLEGNSLTRPSGTPRFCLGVVGSSPLGLKRCRSCHPLPVPGLEAERTAFSFPCPAGPRNFVVPITYNDSEVTARIIVGPVIFDRREAFDRCKEAARNLGIDREDLEDALREIKTFTFRGIQLAIGLLEEVSGYLCHLSYERLKMGIGMLESSFADSGKERFASVDNLLRVLLDVTLRAMKAEAGSIMLLDQRSGELFIKVARGLKEEVVKNVRVKIGEGIAGRVVRDKRALLLNEEMKDSEIRSFLKRPEIQSALVAPLKVTDKVIGVLNVSTVESTNRFTQDNLNLVTHLANRAGEVARGGF